MHEFVAAYLLALIPLLVAVDPLGALPVYITASRNVPESGRLRLYVRSVVAAALIALAFAVVGDAILRALSINVADFQIAGGLMLVAIALYEIVLAGSHPPNATDPSIVPLAVPLTVGPAVMTITLELVQTRGLPITCLALATVLGLLLMLLLLSVSVTKVLSVEAMHLFGKIVYILLAAIGVHYVRIGVMATLAAMTEVPGRG